MICKNCGAVLPDGAIFCPTCGSRQETQTPPSDNTAAQPQQQRSQFSQSQWQDPSPQNQWQTQQQWDDPQAWQPPKKKRSKKPFIIGGVAALVLIAGGGAALAATGVLRRTFSSPEDYYIYVEKKDAEDKISSLAASYDVALERMDAGKDGSHSELTFRLEDGGRPLLANALGTDLSWFRELSLSSDSLITDTEIGSETTVSLNGTQLLSGTIAADLTLPEYYMRIPEISAAYLGVNPSMTGDTEFNTALGNLNTLNSMADLKNYFSDGQELKTFALKYRDLIFKDFSNVRKSSARLTVDTTSEDCTSLTVTLNGTEIADIVDRVVVNMQGDQDLRRLIIAMANDARVQNPYMPDGETFYQSFLDALSQTSESTAELRSDPASYGITSTIWVNKKDEVIGRSISVTDDEETYELYRYMKPHSGNTFALNCLVGDSYGEYILNISGNGTINGSKESSDISIAINENDLYTITITDLDMDALKQGYLNGSFRTWGAPLINALMDELPYGYTLSGTDTLSAAYECYFTLTCENSKDSSKADLTLEYSDSPLFTLSLTTVPESSHTPDFPQDSDTVYNALDDDSMMEYIKSIDWNNVNQIIQSSDLPASYKELAKGYLTQIQNYYSD